ncbi:hypothetical protein [Paenibacillus sp. UASWS1643]|uniref:hypothetical protein n=1 Tax=Paenibacillus sp. UASWS1643 TaxID=2580422 RepID=UPI001CC296AD|nr:hypothetical protein [Paenibacillus sp. UASWS1643]
MNEQWKYERYVLEIKQSMARLNLVEAAAPAQGRTVRDAARSILIATTSLNIMLPSTLTSRMFE